MDANGLHSSFCSLPGCRATCILALVSTSVTVFHLRRELQIPVADQHAALPLGETQPLRFSHNLGRRERRGIVHPAAEVSYVAPQVTGPRPTSPCVI